MSDGIHVPTAAESRLVVERTHAAGGLYVADEVQAGHGRCGPGCGRSRSTASRRTS